VNLLVTGAAGFIGSSLSALLLRNNDQLVSIDNLSTGYEENIPSGVEFIKGDCHDPNVIAQLGNKKFDAVIHIAGQSSGEISFDDPTYDLQTNTQSTLMLLDYAKRTGCPNFIYASSMSVYGNSEEQPVHENMSLHPTSFYAVGKLASEHYLRLYSKFGIKTTALRLFNVYGPGQNLKNLRQGMVSIYLAQAMKNRKVVVKGSGDRFRDLVYIDDVVDAFYKSLSIPKIGYNCYNIGSGEKHSVKNIINKINNHFNNSLDVEYIEPTPGDMFGIYSDSSLARKELSWKCNVLFDEGIQRMFDWACKK
jgi:UDP-glucose 4-epimerase